MHVVHNRSTDPVDRSTAVAAAVSLLRSTDPIDRAAAAVVAESLDHRRLPRLPLSSSYTHWLDLAANWYEARKAHHAHVFFNFLNYVFPDEILKLFSLLDCQCFLSYNGGL